MTSSSSALEPQAGADGSFSLYSSGFGEGFHSPRGARTEARTTFVEPAELAAHPAPLLTVVDVCFGLGYNSAALLEALPPAGLSLDWWGLELDRRPLELALAQPAFRRQWSAPVLRVLEQLRSGSGWEGPQGHGRMLWGEARRHLAEVEQARSGRCHLLFMDAFSPRHCPELWTAEFLQRLARLLAPQGRLITYCSAAAVRNALAQAGLHLAAIRAPAQPEGAGGRAWSQGTVASPSPLPSSRRLRPLSAMEREHLQTRAAEPYRDPSQAASAAEILASRERAQARSGAPSTGSWRRRWGLEHRRVDGPGHAT
ncbi:MULTISPECIES: tRNA (5-methylaminomethyl-2-thiouridine)(34)-methyltransferase MnmD [Aphanothece]|uniref:tRNA (5-methylaminomethyl-2-thiouridine)(34)-methyltransferase MnmD n=1 Tax=Aphanothece TaxID=1121 RepID=UPI0039850B5D